MTTDTTVIHEAAALLAVILSAALSLGALAVCGAIAYYAMRDARHALDVIVRHQDDAASFYKKAVAESVGQTDLIVQPPQDEGGGRPNPVAALDRLRQGVVDDVDEMED